MKRIRPERGRHPWVFTDTESYPQNHSQPCRQMHANTDTETHPHTSTQTHTHTYIHKITMFDPIVLRRLQRFRSKYGQSGKTLKYDLSRRRGSADWNRKPMPNHAILCNTILPNRARLCRITYLFFDCFFVVFAEFKLILENRKCPNIEKNRKK